MRTILHTRQRAYKTELELNHEQITACKRHAGAARWAYNWGLARKQESYHATGLVAPVVRHLLALADSPAYIADFTAIRRKSERWTSGP